MMKRYLDSNVFIYPILYDDEIAYFCKTILLELAEGKSQYYTSILTWDEIVYTIKKNKGKNIAVEEGKNFLKLPNLSFINSNQQVIMKAQEIFETNDINPRDAIHVATALLNNINEIISGDSDFDKIKGIKRIRPEKFR